MMPCSIMKKRSGSRQRLTVDAVQHKQHRRVWRGIVPGITVLEPVQCEGAPVLRDDQLAPVRVCRCTELA